MTSDPFTQMLVMDIPELNLEQTAHPSSPATSFNIHELAYGACALLDHSALASRSKSTDRLCKVAGSFFF